MRAGQRVRRCWPSIGRRYRVAAAGLLLLSLFASSAIGQTVGLRSLRINGADLTYAEQGSGPLMVVVHGEDADHRAFLPHVAELSAVFRVVAYDQRNLGKATWNDSWPPLSMQAQADDLAALIDVLDAGPAHVVGYGVGGRVAQRLAISYPGKVRSLFLWEGVAPVDCLTMARIKVPTVLSAGTRSEFAQVVDVFAPCLGSMGSIVRVRSARHKWPYEEPSKFVALVRNFALQH